MTTKHDLPPTGALSSDMLWFARQYGKCETIPLAANELGALASVIEGVELRGLPPPNRGLVTPGTAGYEPWVRKNCRQLAYCLGTYGPTDLDGATGL